MEKHINIIAILFIAFGIMGLIGASIVMLIFVAGGIFGGAACGKPGLTFIAGIFGMGITGLILICSIPEIIAGIGLLKFRPWARILGLILAALSLVEFPIGTAFGVYVLWALIHDDTVQLFKPESQTTSG